MKKWKGGGKRWLEVGGGGGKKDRNRRNRKPPLGEGKRNLKGVPAQYKRSTMTPT